MLAIDFRFPQWSERLRAHEDELNRLAAAAIQTNRGMLFDAEGAYNGHEKWAPLRIRRGQILSDRGTLRKSIGPQAGADGTIRFTGDRIVVGSNLPYAKMMNYGTTGLPGGVLRPKNGQALRFKAGRNVVFTKSVKIPARDFTSWNDQDQSEVDATLLSKVLEVISRD